MATEDIVESSNRGLYGDSDLSDITVKFNGQHVLAHKAILAHKSTYFRKAFTGLFPVAISEDVDLGDDDDAKAVHAMIRHVYDLPYAQAVTESYTSHEDLVFCMNVFIVADKYDVASLRQQIVPDFLRLLQKTWKIAEFVECVQKLCGPDAIQLADPTLQAAVSEFFTNNLSKITYHSSLVKMVEEDKSFTGRVLAGLLIAASGSTKYLGVCYKPLCSNRTVPDCTAYTEEHPHYLAALNSHCVHCGLAAGTVYNKTGGGTAETRISPRIKVVLM
ncbi:hypothetical protein E4T52_02818 [Aureobasidium sp. EXF-3400]|nr:hypothetical protein E4T51_01205 [Aureobasidium sp. EXF-12344]KAI4782291.1 hypothetical protein E4T52_02818 [Aureobasidium sp. EXF-3400]